jgi:hypothetical protein
LLTKDKNKWCQKYPNIGCVFCTFGIYTGHLVDLSW